MLQAEIISRISGQTSACSRTYSFTFSGFSPKTCPMRCMSPSPSSNRRRELVNRPTFDFVPIPIHADARLGGRQLMAVLDRHVLAGDLVELRDIFHIFAVRHGAGEADMQLHQEMRADRH